MLESLYHDLRDAARALRKRPIFTFVVIMTLGVGIGATTAIFSVVNSVLLRPLSYHDSDQLFVIHEVVPQWVKSDPLLDANLPDFLIWQKESQAFKDIALAESTTMILTGSGEAQQLRGTRASANFLALLGVHPALGRSFRPEEDLTGRGQVVILTDSFWHSRFSADSAVVGRSITLDGVPHTIVGILPQSFRLPGGVNGFSTRAQFFTPLNGPKSYEQDLIGEFDFTAIGRLKPDVSVAQAVAELNVIQSSIAKQADSKLDLRADIFPLQSEVVGPARRGLILLLAAVGAVLLMIWVNLANLQFARVPGRMREAGIRIALGATRLRIMQQMLVESLLLASLGGGLGILLAQFGVRWLVHFGPADLPRLNEVSLDARGLGFVVLASIATAAFFGALPAWLVSRASLHDNLGSGGKSVTENRRTRQTRATLVSLEVAACTLLLIVAGLLGRSLLNLLHLDPGFSVEHVLATDIDMPPAAYEKPASREEFYSRVLDDVRKLPGVRSVAWISILPLEGQGSISGINLPGNVLPPEQQPLASYRAVSPDYFQTMGIPLVAGRVFTGHDRGRRLVIVSQGLAHRLWPNTNPIGQQCLAEWGDLQLSEVIGVAGDIHTRLDQLPLYMVYVADSWGGQAPSAPSFASIVVRTAQDPASLAAAVRDVVHRAGPEVPIVAMRPMSQLVAVNVEGRRFQISLTSSFAISALLLASLGIFGVLAYSVEQRQREFGIRTALGAQRPRLLGMVMRQGLSPVAVGFAVGSATALMSGSFLQSLLSGVASFDPLTFAAVALLIALVAMIACYIPARRATQVDPIVALRYE
ncbi:MAG: ABC transporter permease [Candidatus Acidiferrales bacterium]